MRHHHWLLSILGLAFLWAGFTGIGTFPENISTKALQTKVFANEIFGGDGGKGRLQLLEINAENLHEEYSSLVQKLSTLEIDKDSVEDGITAVEEKAEKPISWIRKIITQIKKLFSKDTQEKISDKTDELLEQKAELEEKIADIQERYTQAKEAAISLREALQKMRDAANESNESLQNLGDAFRLPEEE